MISQQGKASQYQSRWSEVRLLSARGLSAPYIFDRKAGGSLTPYCRDEWVYDEVTAQLWPAIRGGSGWNSVGHPRWGLGVPSLPSPVGVTQAFSTAYVNAGDGTGAGGSVAQRYKGDAKTLTSAYCYISAKTGTVTTLNYQVRNDNSNLPTGSILCGGSGTINPDAWAAAGWWGASGLSVSLSADTPYWLVWGDADSDGSNFVTLWHHATVFSTERDFGNQDALRTSAGYASGNTAVLNVGSMVLGFADGLAAGNPLVTVVAFTNNQNRRGFHFNSGFTEQLKIRGLIVHTNVAGISGIEVYDNNATVPGTGALATGTNTFVQSTNIYGAYLSTPYTLAKETGYRVVFTFGSNSTTNYYSIGTGADVVLASAMQGAGGWYTAQANGTTAWYTQIDGSGISLAYTFPRMALIVEDQVAVVPRGGTLLTGGRM